MNKYIILIIVIIILAIYPAYLFLNRYQSQTSSPSDDVPSPQTDTDNIPTDENVIGKAEYNTPVYPIAEFKSRITKKPFGIKITPQDSPVSPERFSGYHTGTDIEYQDVSKDVPIFAITDGIITLSRTVSGYGGVLILESRLDKTRSIIYGHIRPSSLPTLGSQFKKGDQIGLLGIGFSSETNNERRHLHFGILSDNRTDVTGYVPSESALSGWIDPTILYQP